MCNNEEFGIAILSLVPGEPDHLHSCSRSYLNFWCQRQTLNKILLSKMIQWRGIKILPRYDRYKNQKCFFTPCPEQVTRKRPRIMELVLKAAYYNINNKTKYYILIVQHLHYFFVDKDIATVGCFQRKMTLALKRFQGRPIKD